MVADLFNEFEDLQHKLNAGARVIHTARGEIEYADTGSGLPVLTVHGSPGGYDQGLIGTRWLDPKQFRVISPSRPGYLRTPLSSGTTMNDQADLLAVLIEELELGPVAVMGASGGGPAAYLLAARHPHLVRRLLTIDAVSGPFRLPHLSWVEQALFLSGVGTWLVHTIMPHFPKQVIEMMLQQEGHFDRRTLHKRLAEIIADPKKTHFCLDTVDTLAPFKLRKPGFDNDLEQFANLSIPLEKITAPTMVIFGEADINVSPEQGKQAAAAIPGARLYLLENGIHVDFYISNHADEAQAAARAFLQENVFSPN